MTVELFFQVPLDNKYFAIDDFDNDSTELVHRPLCPLKKSLLVLMFFLFWELIKL